MDLVASSWINSIKLDRVWKSCVKSTVYRHALYRILSNGDMAMPSCQNQTQPLDKGNNNYLISNTSIRNTILRAFRWFSIVWFSNTDFGIIKVCWISFQRHVFFWLVFFRPILEIKYHCVFWKNVIFYNFSKNTCK